MANTSFDCVTEGQNESPTSCSCCSLVWHTLHWDGGLEPSRLQCCDPQLNVVSFSQNDTVNYIQLPQCNKTPMSLKVFKTPPCQKLKVFIVVDFAGSCYPSWSLLYLLFIPRKFRILFWSTISKSK